MNEPPSLAASSPAASSPAPESLVSHPSLFPPVPGAAGHARALAHVINTYFWADLALPRAQAAEARGAGEIHPYIHAHTHASLHTVIPARAAVNPIKKLQRRRE